MGRWLVFWGVGVRLGLAGLRQVIQPRFNAQNVFHMSGDEALPLVRELGVANLGTALIALISFAAPSFVLPAAISASLFFGFAGVVHMGERSRSRNENIAMVSDVLASPPKRCGHCPYPRFDSANRSNLLAARARLRKAP